MTPHEFTTTWRASKLKERSGFQEHFTGLCRLLGEPTPTDPRGIAIAEPAQRLVELRDRRLDPPEWVDSVDQAVSGYPKRPVPRNENAAKALKKRTLTDLHNARPQLSRRRARGSRCRCRHRVWVARRHHRRPGTTRAASAEHSPNAHERRTPEPRH